MATGAICTGSGEVWIISVSNMKLQGSRLRDQQVLILEKSPRSKGIGGRLSNEIQERFFDFLDCPAGKITAADVHPPVSKALEETMLPNVDKIKAKIFQTARHN